MRGIYDRRPIRCEHCRRAISTDKMAAHLPRCTHNPDNFDKQRNALDDGHGFIRGVRDYERDLKGGVSADMLRNVFTGWPGVAAYYGLGICDHRKRQPSKAAKLASPERQALDAPGIAASAKPEAIDALDYQSPHCNYTPHGFVHCGVRETDREVRWVLR